MNIHLDWFLFISLLWFFFELHLLDDSSGNAAVGALVVCVTTTDT